MEEKLYGEEKILKEFFSNEQREKKLVNFFKRLVVTYRIIFTKKKKTLPVRERLTRVEDLNQTMSFNDWRRVFRIQQPSNVDSTQRELYLQKSEL